MDVDVLCNGFVVLILVISLEHFQEATAVSSTALSGLLIREQMSLSVSTIQSTSDPKSNCQRNEYGPNCVYCLEHDTCQEGHYTCDANTGAKICLPGWKGDSCLQKDIAFDSYFNLTCPENSCRNGGLCVSGTCCCQFGYTGVLCQIETIECQSRPCQNGGICRDLVGTYECSCRNGFSGQNCESYLSTVPPTFSVETRCDAFTCKNGGTCFQDSNNTYCVCPLWYSGVHCETSLRTGSNQQNSACPTDMYGKDCSVHCTPGNSCRHGHYICDPRNGQKICLEGWMGDQCNIRRLPQYLDTACPSHLHCKNGGQCFEGQCCCEKHYSGQFCTIISLGCQSNPCQNGATCIAKSNTSSDYKCSCDVGFKGKFCETSVFSTTVSAEITSTDRYESSQNLHTDSDHSSPLTTSIRNPSIMSSTASFDSDTSETNTLSNLNIESSTVQEILYHTDKDGTMSGVTQFSTGKSHLNTREKTTTPAITQNHTATTINMPSQLFTRNENTRKVISTNFPTSVVTAETSTLINTNVLVTERQTYSSKEYSTHMHVKSFPSSNQSTHNASTTYKTPFIKYTSSRLSQLTPRSNPTPLYTDYSYNMTASSYPLLNTFTNATPVFVTAATLSSKLEHTTGLLTQGLQTNLNNSTTPYSSEQNISQPVTSSSISETTSDLVKSSRSKVTPSRSIFKSSIFSTLPQTTYSSLSLLHNQTGKTSRTKQMETTLHDSSTYTDLKEHKHLLDSSSSSSKPVRVTFSTVTSVLSNGTSSIATKPSTTHVPLKTSMQKSTDSPTTITIVEHGITSNEYSTESQITSPLPTLTPSAFPQPENTMPTQKSSTHPNPVITDLVYQSSTSMTKPGNETLTQIMKISTVTMQKNLTTTSLPPNTTSLAFFLKQVSEIPSTSNKFTVTFGKTPVPTISSPSSANLTSTILQSASSGKEATGTRKYTPLPSTSSSNDNSTFYLVGSEKESSTWWIIIVAIVLGTILLAAIAIASVTIFKYMLSRESRTLKRSPDEIVNFDKEHFSVEPEFDNPVYMDEPDFQDDTVKSDMYIVNREQYSTKTY